MLAHDDENHWRCAGCGSLFLRGLIILFCILEKRKKNVIVFFFFFYKYSAIYTFGIQKKLFMDRECKNQTEKHVQGDPA